MSRLPQVVLIGSAVIGSWLGMQAVHELGHVLGSKLSGGQVARVVLHPLTISRTDLAENPRPLVTAWFGPVVGVTVPLVLCIAAAGANLQWAFMLRFFAGFCLVANGLYIGVGSFGRVGDCGEMLRHGSAPWQLWLFGAATTPVGFWLWRGQGPHFGLGPANGRVSRGVAYGSLVGCLVLVLLGFAIGGG